MDSFQRACRCHFGHIGPAAGRPPQSDSLPLQMNCRTASSVILILWAPVCTCMRCASQTNHDPSPSLAPTHESSKTRGYSTLILPTMQVLFLAGQDAQRSLPSPPCTGALPDRGCFAGRAPSYLTRPQEPGKFFYGDGGQPKARQGSASANMER